MKVKLDEIGRTADGRGTSFPPCGGITSSVASSPALPRNDRQQKKLSWADDPSVQRLLDVVSSIIADEYIGVAKQNPDVFKNGGGK